jgi:hypothetical protein
MRTKEMLDEVGNRYRRYLRTSFYMRDPRLAQSFAEALHRENLTKGPYLEVTPRFKHGASLRQCLRAWFPDEDFDDAFLAAIHADRPLYQHQEEAIHNALIGRNVIVATGTGSGKTEAFLLPIFIDLYRNFRRYGMRPGVKALILYPMNALVADQRERLGAIANSLAMAGSAFAFSFGQYIGATPDSDQDRYREAYDLFPNELGTRKAMQQSPPDILITNYSMLEYLLIRPDDSPLFDGGRAQFWRFIVLDEAHQYRGAKGMEMAMLIRRLKNRLKQGGRTQGWTSVATSASLADPSQAASEAVASFAQTLFGEPFDPKDVVFGTTDPVALNGREYPDPSVYAHWRDQAEADPAALVDGLKQDGRLAHMAQRLAKAPTALDELAQELFPQIPGDQAQDFVDDLAACAVKARLGTEDLPLLPLRYHFLVRALEGVRIAFSPDPKIYLTGGGTSTDQHLFDIALCSGCGQHFIDGRIVAAHMAPAIRDPGHDEYSPQYYLPRTNGMTRPAMERWMAENRGIDEDEGGIFLMVLCAHCGGVGVDQLPSCTHDDHLVGLEAVESESALKPSCPVCETKQRIGPVLHGADGPHAVVTTALFSMLEPEHRKILAFADSRQRAAFFAWYLQNSHEVIARRNLLYHVLVDLAKTSSEISLNDSVAAYAARLESEGWVDQSATFQERRRQARLDVLREVLNENKAISLEGTGLLAGRIQLTQGIHFAPEWLRPWNLSPEIAQELCAWLLSTLVEDNAVDFGIDDVDFSWGDLGLMSQQTVAVMGPKAGVKGTIAIDGPKTRRLALTAEILASVAHRQGDGKAFVGKAEAFIRSLVEIIQAAQMSAPERDRLLLVSAKGYRVNLRWWRWRIPGTEALSRQDLRICSHCHRLSFWQLGDLCPVYRCQGRLQAIDESQTEDHHYRRLYADRFPGQLRAEEHTAQLERSKAIQFQREFKQGHIHVLSSSTTFELGVDLGDLNVVFLRNVPPENFNYVQRVGRAGRREGSPGVAVTYCGRSPHDLYHFEDPTRMIVGNSRPPVIKLGNDVLVLRHWMAVILSLFFRQGENSQRFHTVEELFGGHVDAPDILLVLRRFVDSEVGLDDLFFDLVPESARRRMTVPWREAVLGESSRLARAVMEVSSDYRRVKALETDRSQQQDYKTALWAMKRANEIARQDVLSFLSRKVVIPKYGFPVDVVGLDLLWDSKEAHTVTLQRDLSQAIAEFAPTAEVVANKRVWTSRALKTVPDMAWPRDRYRRCSAHGVLERAKNGEFAGAVCCANMQEAEYVIPIFGFTTNRDPAKAPTRALERFFSTRPFFVDEGEWGMAPVVLGEPSTEGPLLEAFQVRPGDIVVVSEGRRGQGFWVCAECGYADIKRVKKHQTPWGVPCAGSALSQVALAHQFKTDILKISFPRQPQGSLGLAYGVAYALQYGAADFLEVPLTDLNAIGLLTSPLSVLLYDNVPGGAGLVSQLSDAGVLRECVRRAQARVAGQCGCDQTSSCYGCLKSYGNQFLHHQLARGPVDSLLQGFLES